MTSKLPSYKIPPVTGVAQGIRAKLADVAIKKHVRHILLKDHEHKVIGVVVDLDEFNLMMKIVETAIAAKVLESAVDTSDDEDMALEDVF